MKKPGRDGARHADELRWRWALQRDTRFKSRRERRAINAELRRRARKAGELP